MMMKYLIVNADDFGASRGINRGIIEAHRNGIVTSTSLMVNAPRAEEAAELASQVWHLSVGLHVDLPRGPDCPPDQAREEIAKQFARFMDLMRQPPTHLDSHHNVHCLAHLLPVFSAFADERGLPLRDHSFARCVPAFYGSWSGESHPEQISVVGLLHIIETDVRAGVTELSCHPGYADDELASSYLQERELELRTLCDPAIAIALVERGIVLVNHHDLNHLATRVAA